MERVANSARDEQILSGHVEAIRTALIDYQVRSRRVNIWIIFRSDIV